MDANAERASKLATITASDALDKLGIPGQCLGIRPRGHGFQLAGRAFTLLYEARKKVGHHGLQKRDE